MRLQGIFRKWERENGIIPTWDTPERIRVKSVYYARRPQRDGAPRLCSRTASLSPRTLFRQCMP
ncbi:MAG: hypothetical protein MZV63_64230 [Marinilabiliales bacterium]|nr:hypothetical protein [Marinilabiliales bacterium]